MDYMLVETIQKEIVVRHGNEDSDRIFQLVRISQEKFD